MEIALNKITSNEFFPSFEKLMLNPELTVSLAWRLHPSFKAVKEALKNYEDLRTVLLDKYTEKDAEGKKKISVVTLPNGAVSSQFDFSPENRPLFEADLKPLTEELVSLPAPKVKVTELKDELKLNAMDLDSLIDVVLIPA